jgi:hypothetical protein
VEKHDTVSILFADICNFTPLTTTLRVDKLVETLNDLFGKFDEAADVSDFILKTDSETLLSFIIWNS